MSEVIDRAVQQLGYTATKEHQRTVVEGLVGGKDVFSILPIGYGKSLCYACLPLVFACLPLEVPIHHEEHPPNSGKFGVRGRQNVFGSVRYTR